MNYRPAFARDETELASLERVVAGAVSLDVTFPDWPFVVEQGYVRIFDYNQVLSGYLGSLLGLLARQHGDERIVVSGRSPDYYFSSFGYFPIFEVDPATVDEDYWKVMSWCPPGWGASLTNTLDAIAIAGSSGQWGIMAQRDWEIGLLVTQHNDVDWGTRENLSYGLDLDLEVIRAPAGWGMPLSDEVLARFWKNVREHAIDDVDTNETSVGGRVGAAIDRKGNVEMSPDHEAQSAPTPPRIAPPAAPPEPTKRSVPMLVFGLLMTLGGGLFVLGRLVSLVLGLPTVSPSYLAEALGRWTGGTVIPVAVLVVGIVLVARSKRTR